MRQTNFMSSVPLKILNASAGSGKTYSLVKTFMHLLLAKEPFNPNKYSEILAMTFTNKAALEMKIRILGALDKLTYPELYPEDNYLFVISDELGQNPEEVQDHAQNILYSILHNYEAFNVLTIDKFNLRLIRSFSRDLDLPSDFEVVINQDQIIEQVVDTVMSEIGQNELISEFIMRYVELLVEEEKSWNFRKNLIDFAKILTKEQDLPYVERLMKETFSIEDFKTLRTQLTHFDKEYIALAQQVVKAYAENPVANDEIVGGHHTKNRIEKLKTVKKFDRTDGPFTASKLEEIAQGAHAKKATPAPLHYAMQELALYYINNLENYCRLEIIVKNYFNMALLQHLNKALQEVNQNERVILISEFNTRISELLLQEDTLYIYEKLGVKFRNFMLDEFQDTSRLQWINLVPLLHESISKGDKNLIVGDPKQAIYRFKNGVAEQFVELPGIYNPENDPKLALTSTFFQTMGAVEILPNNFRSAREIVEFNNTLFTAISYEMGDEERLFYNNIVQVPKSSKTGYISIEAIHASMKPDEHLDFILSSIKEAQADGYKLGDICILGNKNNSCTIWANQLTEQGFKIVSADSLNVDSDLGTRLVLAYLKVVSSPTDENFQKQMVHQFCLVKGKTTQFYFHYFDQKENYKSFNIERFIVDNIKDFSNFFRKFETLYDLVQNAFSLLELDELRNTYLHHFADIVYQFELRNGPDLPKFLKEYTTLSKETKAVQIPESDDAIQIMTIHKSKGLEFPVVILIHDKPISSKQHNSYFIEDDDQLLYTPLSSNSNLQSVQQRTEEETRKIQLDEYNKYYVAYTRPEERLYVRIPFESEKTSDFIYVKHIFEDSIAKGERAIHTIGERVTKTYKTTDHSSTYYIPSNITDNLWFPDIALQDMEELQDSQLLSDERRYGTQFHLLISNYNAADNVESLINRGLQEGWIEEQFTAQLQIDLEQVLSNADYKALFADAIETLDEMSLLVSPTEIIRPDKIILKEQETIVVDFKTGIPKNKDIKQLKNYKGALSNMGHTSVKAYLFYLLDLRLEEV